MSMTWPRAAAHTDDVAKAAARVDDVTDVAKRNPLDMPCSFDADTPVQTPAGLTPIHTLQSGDLVFAFDEATGTTGVYTITGRAAHLDPAVVTLTIADETIDTTPEHPFYVATRGWVEAGQLVMGDRIRRLDDSYGEVVAVRQVVRPEVMYNLTVAGAHTFFVGEKGWLVHNCPVSRTPGPTIDRATGQEVGRLVVDPTGNAMIEPVGGRTVAAGSGGIDTHTLYPNGSNYQRLNPQGHTGNPTPHAHGHLPGTGPGMRGQGPAIDPLGNIVPWNSAAAHWIAK